MSPTERSIAEFITQLADPTGSLPLLPPEQSLLEAGVLDSLGLQQLVQHIEARHGVALGEEHYSAENFESIAAVARLVDSLRG